MRIPDGFLDEWCRVFSKGSEMPPLAYLPTGLVVLASIVGPRLIVPWSEVVNELCNVWVLNVGRSALARKTTGLSAAEWGIHRARRTLADQVRWYDLGRVSDAQLAVDLDVVGEDTEKAQEAENAVAEAEKRKPRKVEPTHRRIPVAHLMAANEMTDLWGESQRDWQRSTQGLLLQLYDGKLSSRTRASAVESQRTFTCAIGNIPPRLLADRTTMSTIASGYAGRWLLMETPGPENPVSLFEGRENGSDPLAGLGELVDRLAAMARACTEPIQSVKHLWTPEAKAARHAWYVPAFNVHRVDPDDADAEARGMLWGRMQAYAAKLAVLVAVSRQVARVDRLEEVRVESEDVEWAQGVVDVALGRMMGVWQAGGGGAITSLGRVENRVVVYLHKHDHVGAESSVTLSKLSQAVKHSDEHGAVVRAIDALVAAGVVGSAVRPPAGGGREGRRLWVEEDRAEELGAWSR